MDSNEIEFFMQSEINFVGVFPFDRRPDIKRLPSGVIFNLDEASKPGSHWVAVYFRTYFCCEYFDSFGSPPTKSLRNYLFKYSNKIYYNNVTIQAAMSFYCGLFAVNCLTNRLLGNSFYSILRQFTSDREINHYLV